LPKLKPNVPRIVESILFVIGEAIRGGTPATKYEIAKAIFIADTRHLKTFGRPITYDNYVAMKDGPVPSMTLDILQPGYDWGRIGGKGPLWTTKAAPRGGPNAIEYVRPKREANLEKLSETDVEALRSALADVQAMGFHRTRDFTHRDPAYLKAWAKRGAAKRMMIDYHDLPASEDLIDDLIHTSRHM
jgi:uncharacterized phage-associated protein